MRHGARVAPRRRSQREPRNTKPAGEGGSCPARAGEAQVIGDTDLPLKPEPSSSGKLRFLAMAELCLWIAPSGGSEPTRGDACSQTPCRRQSMPHALSPDSMT